MFAVEMIALSITGVSATEWLSCMWQRKITVYNWKLLQYDADRLHTYCVNRACRNIASTTITVDSSDRDIAVAATS